MTPMVRLTVLLASLALIFALSPSTATAHAGPSPTGSWIVTLRDGVDPSSTASAIERSHGGQVRFVYEHALNGFSFRGSEAAASALARNPNVTRVEPNAEVWLDATQTNATWGLDRVDQRNLPLSGTYSYERTGAGVTAYVIDSGIRFSHSEFAGRAVHGADFVGDGQNGNDCNGHGTHVAGTIAGSTYGVAKNASLVSVRVFGCSGGSAWDVIIAGIDWVIQHHTGGPAVANMSLGGGGSTSVDTATNNLINDGVATAVAAGNGNVAGRQADACNYSPARVPNAMTISATNSSDQKPSWANYGTCVDWFAPGVTITSAWYTSNTATNTISGTSMATPHTAGVAALYLEANPGHSPLQVRDAIYAATTKGVVSSSSTANNHLLYSGFVGGTPGDSPPTVAITSPAEGATLSGATMLVASASDDVGVTQVAFYHGSTHIGTDTSSSGGWSVTWNTTTLADGPYMLTARATDTAGQTTTSASVGVTVANSSGGGDDGTFSLALNGSASNQGSTWTATVTITATDSTGAPVVGVTVNGTWAGGTNDSCLTAASGSCTVSRSQAKRVGSVTYTVTSASHQDLDYDGGPDSVTVSKP
jgi:subtilisin family serine protease